MPFENSKRPLRREMSTASMTTFNSTEWLFLTGQHSLISSSYMRRAEHVFTPDYLPSDEDVLLASSNTELVAKLTFVHDGEFYRVFDVGGFRFQRKDWRLTFERCHGVVFVASLSGYDECLREDKQDVSLQLHLLIFMHFVTGLAV